MQTLRRIRSILRGLGQRQAILDDDYDPTYDILYTAYHFIIIIILGAGKEA
jgi:hypothetical protein